MTEGARQKNEQWDPAENGQMVIGESARSAMNRAGCDRLRPAACWTEAPHVDFCFPRQLTHEALFADNSVSNNEAPPDPFASLEKDVTQKARALSESERLTALFEKNDSHWSDPYAASYALRASFREKKRVRLESEAKAEEVKSRFGLGDRARIEDLRTPKPGSEEAAWEKREWERAKGEMERVKEERESKRRREEEQAGWKVSTDQVQRSKDAERKKRPRSSIEQPQREAGISSLSSLSNRSRRYSEPSATSRQTASSKPTSTTRQIAPLPKSRSFSSALISTKSGRSASASPSIRQSPALKALHSKLSLATALKQDPFAAKPASSPALPSSASSSALASSSGVRLVKKP